MIAYPHIAARLFGVPLAIEPRALKSLLDGIGPRLLAIPEGVKPIPDRADFSDFAQKKRGAVKHRLSAIVEGTVTDVGEGMGEYAVTPGGVAVVPVLDTLVNRFDWIAALCGLTSYETLGYVLDAAMNDHRVKAVMLDIDSPGGEAAGMLDAADRIRRASSVKPVWAVANSLAASAGYGLACAANRLVLPRLATVGSIGVVAVHTDHSAEDKERGLKFTALYSGARKIDGWGHAPLSEEARERFQADIDEARRKFATSVAKHRNMTVEEVLATEAGTYDDDRAVTARLADAVMTFDDVLAELTTRVKIPSPRGTSAALHPGTGKESTMTDASKQAGDAAPADKPADVKPEPTKEPEKKTEDGGSKFATAAAIAEACEKAGFPSLTASLLQEPATMEAVSARLVEAKEIKDTADKVGLPSLASKLIGLPVAQAREILFEAKAAGEGQNDTANSGAPQSSAAWDKVIDRINARQ